MEKYGNCITNKQQKIRTLFHPILVFAYEQPQRSIRPINNCGNRIERVQGKEEPTQLEPEWKGSIDGIPGTLGYFWKITEL